jgi:hypothetical protein
MLKIKKVSMEVYETTLNGTTFKWMRLWEYPKFPHVFSNIVSLERALNHGSSMADADMLYCAVKGAHEQRALGAA